jgi:hypothetical protein
MRRMARIMAGPRSVADTRSGAGARSAIGAGIQPAGRLEPETLPTRSCDHT